MNVNELKFVGLSLDELRNFPEEALREARGKWEKFSLEMLIILATKAGIRVTLKTAA